MSEYTSAMGFSLMITWCGGFSASQTIGSCGGQTKRSCSSHKGLMLNPLLLLFNAAFIL